jgi:hypothetical protein
MTDSTTRVGVAHPTVVPGNHRQRDGADGGDEEATNGAASA